MTSDSYAKPRPRIDALTQPFWDAARERRLVVQHCPACGDVRFPPGPVCPKCLSPDQAWKEASGKGTLQSWIEFHRAYWDGFKEELPYSVCLVQLAEGPLLVSNLVGDSASAKLGAAVEVVFDPVADDLTLPKFRLV